MAKKAEKLRTGIPLWSKQVEFLNLVKGGCHSPIGFVSGRNCGKSHVGCVVCCLTAKAGDRILIVSPDTNVIAETTWPIFEQVARMTGQWIRGVRSPIYRAFIRTSDGGQATVVFRGAEKPDKLRGGNYALIWFDECSVITVESYKTAIGCGRWKGKMAPVLMTFTPRGRKHWTFNTFYDMVPDEQLFKLPNASEFEEGFVLPDGPFEHDDRIYNTHAETNIQGRWYNCKDRAALVRAKTKDNPFAPEQYATFLQSQYTSEFAIQELEGLFIDVAGLMFRREWFTKFVDKAPRHARRIRYWDLAATEDGGCFTVGTLMAKNLDGMYYIEDVKKGQWGALERNQMILTTAQMDARAYNDEVEIYVEQEPGSGGLEQSQQIVRMLAGFPIYRDLPTGGSSWRMVDGHKVAGPAKIIKARPLSAQSEAGNVILVRGSFNTPLLDALCSFPHSTYIDEVDSASSCFNKLCSRDTGAPGDIMLLNSGAPEQAFGDIWRRGMQLSELARSNN
jgi:phage terminase large subunit-like protein